MKTYINSRKEKLLSYYEKNETQMDVAFFIAGFVFDVITLSDVDDLFGLGQQVFYLLITGSLLALKFLDHHGLTQFPQKFPRIWNYRTLIFHFILGSLLSVYSLFFLKSASLFNSVLFVVVIMLIMVANELKSVQEKGMGLKSALWVLCLFSFFSMLMPVVLGFVGPLPFTLSLLLTSLIIYALYKKALSIVASKSVNPINVATKQVQKEFLWPSLSIISLFIVFYLIGWIPPVPLSLKTVGIYHNIEKTDGKFILSHENPWWRFWHRGDQEFNAVPGDRIFVYAQIFAPKRFNDSIVLHWMFNDPRRGWITSDRLKMPITGGRRSGFRGFAFKQNYQAGEWRVLVETSDEREIGRIYFDVNLLTHSNPLNSATGASLDATETAPNTRVFKRIYFPEN